MYAKGLIAARDGNVSVRLSEARLLMTPSGVNKGFLAPDAIVMTDLAGNKVRGGARFNASSELKMHLAVYRARPDVCSVVHAHAPFSVAFSLAGVPLSDPLIPEVVATLGAIPTTPYATPTTEDVVDAIREPITHHNALVMARHGTLTVGCDVFEAYDRLETVEHTARIVFATRLLGGAHPLGAQEVERLEEIGRLADTLSLRKVDCASCRTAGTADFKVGTCGSVERDAGRAPPRTTRVSEEVIERVVQEVRKRLG